MSPGAVPHHWPEVIMGTLNYNTQANSKDIMFIHTGEKECEESSLIEMKHTGPHVLHSGWNI